MVIKLFRRIGIIHRCIRCGLGKSGGLAGNNFIYNDPVDSDGRGYGRVISAETLEQAMAGATGQYARAAFAVGR